MGLIAKRCFPNAVQVIDRFQVQQLATEALQEIRIKHRWEAIDNENQTIEACKKAKETYFPEILFNGDTLNSYWQEVGIYSIRVSINGPVSRKKEL